MMKYLQRIGRSLMLPIAILPAASLILGVGYAISTSGSGAQSQLAAFLIKSGGAIVDNMSILFAIGVALGMSKDRDGSAALSGLVAFLVVTTVLSTASVSQLMRIATEEVNPAFGKINNQFIGIISGIVAATVYNYFHDIQLPEFLAFFSGKRFVPILTAACMLVVSGVLFFIWPTIYTVLVEFGKLIMGLGAVGAGLYGFFNRLLIPLGLHHTLNSVFWFDIAGINDIGRWLSSVESAYENIPLVLQGKYVVGMYQAGFFPVMMFGLPAAGLAMYFTAKPEQKKVIGSLMLAAGFTSFFTGVTEPLEFSFMFVAPALYVAHAALTGITVAVVAMLKYTAGFAFSAGLIDYVISLRNPNANNTLLLIPIGIIVAVVYFVVFVTMIKTFDIKTPGRTDGEIDNSQLDEILGRNDKKAKFVEMAKVILIGLGGKENLTSIDNCITRLRLEVKDVNLINKDVIKSSGAINTVVIDEHSVQVIIGPQVQFVADELKKL
ncbi:N-acetylglucosamine-specific PTS transporter subunit IIBC [Caviibacter abscessus]|uniref:N-acetylglucosamine-specific PTS transporter subunit IIBC n=1 Tax=Caviibacter abscessus TaxID=1766719 RepID=UPI000839138B|nr:N-acetylglucosamine-specific PTS transporter subunit IIBC [Caviibacter abscessus]